MNNPGAEGIGDWLVMRRLKRNVIGMQIRVNNTSIMAGLCKFFIVIMLYGFSSSLQEVEFSASAPSVVEVGEQFRITYSLNASGSDLRLPDLGNFQLVGRPSTSSSSSIQMINGQMTQTQSVSFTYVLSATEAGTYTVGPATINTDSGQRSSNPVTIEVVSDGEGRTSVPAQSGTNSSSAPHDISDEDIFVRVLLDRNAVYRGEALVATVKLYSRLDLTGIENVRLPSFSDFFQQDIEIPPLRSLDREVINGVIYGTGILKQVILFPQRSGEINISSFEMDALVRQRTGGRGSLFDDFFGGFETRRIPVKSPPLTLTVNPLPEQKPPGFEGGVGNFDFKVDVEPEETTVNEAMNMRVTISGAGNLRLLSQPSIDFPADFEVFDPDINENIINSTRGQEGSITFDYLLIPRSSGNFRIPPVMFSYFNPSEGAFRTISSGGFNLLVEQGELGEDGPSVAGYAREDLQILGKDIRFIKTGNVVFKRIDRDIFGSFRFYLWFIIPLFIFSGLLILQRKKVRDRSNIAMMKTRRAGKTARKRLKTAGRFLKENNSQPFFEELLRAVWGYLSDRLLIAVSDLNRNNAKSELLKRNVPEEDVERLMEIISDCEFARYAPSASEIDMDRIYHDTIRIITLVEQNLR